MTFAMATAVRTSGSLSCTEILGRIEHALAAIKSLNLYKLVNGTLLGLTNAIDELTKKIGPYTDPQIEFEIENLRQRLRELKILIKRRFIPGCKSVARFVTRGGQLERIRADLEAGRAEKLREFLDTLRNHLNSCKERANKFEVEHDKLKEKVTAAMYKHGTEERKLKDDVRTNETLLRSAAVVGGLSVTGAVVAIGLTAVAPGVVAYLVFSGGLIGGAAATGAASVVGATLKFKKEDYTLIESVTKHINELNVEMNQIKKKFLEILGDLETANDSLTAEIKDGKSIQGKATESIMGALKDFKEDMTQLLTACDREE